MERQKNIYGKNTERLVVSFVCPVGREFDAADVLESLGQSQITSTFKETERKLIGQDGQLIIQKGFEFTGELDSDSLKTLIESLAEKKVAGYSRETQIISRTSDPEQSL